MSRTDKDLPYWMLSKTWEPNHVACEHALWRRGRRECDLPDSPVMERPIISRWRSNTPTGCYWSPTWDHFWRPAEKGVPTWYVRLEFTGPERRRVRDECREALKEYNGYGEVDTTPSTTQHRHMARWAWW